MLSKIYRKIHRMIEDNIDKKISHREMSEKLNCSIDTYGGHIRGTNEPISVKHFIQLINMLDDEDQIVLLKFIRKEFDANQNK